MEGRSPVGGTKKTWSKVVEEETRKLNTHRRYDRGQTTVEAIHILSNPRSRKLGMLKEDDKDDNDEDEDS